MKKIIKIAALTCFSLVVFKGESGDGGKYVLANNSMRAGVAFMPTLSSGRVVGESQMGQVNYSQKIGYNYGVIGSYMIGKKSFVESGIMHQLHILNFNQKTTPNFTFFNDALERETTVRFASFSIPVRMLFYDNLFRFRRYISVGSVVNFMYSRRQHETYTFGDNSQVTDAFNNKGGFRMVSPEIRMGFGFEYDLENDLSIRVEPLFSLGFFRGDSKANMVTFGLLVAAQLQQ